MNFRIRARLPTRGLQQARSLRRNATNVENELWYHLRGGRMNGIKFRRQHPIPPYTVDFYCEAAKLVIELDGAQHEARSDRRRTECLESQGLRVIRFDNVDVVRHRDAVLQAIWDAVAPFAPHPNPSPAGRGA
jgi:very-short-patch-repair endonuclease